jgi:hypothetical protein
VRSKFQHRRIDLTDQDCCEESQKTELAPVKEHSAMKQVMSILLSQNRVASANEYSQT